MGFIENYPNDILMIMIFFLKFCHVGKIPAIFTGSGAEASTVACDYWLGLAESEFLYFLLI